MMLRVATGVVGDHLRSFFQKLWVVFLLSLMPQLKLRAVVFRECHFPLAFQPLTGRKKRIAGNATRQACEPFLQKLLLLHLLRMRIEVLSVASQSSGVLSANLDFCRLLISKLHRRSLGSHVRMIDDGGVLINRHSSLLHHPTPIRHLKVSLLSEANYSSSGFHRRLMIMTVSFHESGSLWNYPHYYSGTYYL